MWRLDLVMWLLQRLVLRQGPRLIELHIMDDVMLARQVLGRAAEKVH